jgi:DNA-binding XRE family transcriptional regulator
VNEPRLAGVTRHDDGHQDDFGNRNMLRLKIITGLEDRRRNGTPLHAVAKQLGHARDFATTPYHPDRHPTSVWLWNQTWDLCQGALLTLRIRFVGIDATSPMWDMAQDLPQFQGVGAMELLKQARIDLDITNQAMADRLGIAKSAVWKSEEGSDPRLSTIQRYARALGGRALYSGRMK